MAENNPYAPPAAELGLALETAPAVPGGVLKKIRNAWVAGVISTCLTLVVTLTAVSGIQIAGYSAWQFIDVVLVAALTFGIYKRSRTCAVSMLLYFIVSKIILFVETGRPNGLLLAIVFTYYYAQGVAGTFAYHRHIAGR